MCSTRPCGPHRRRADRGRETAAALGGRDVKASVISFTLPSDVSAAARPRPLAARWSLAGPLGARQAQAGRLGRGLAGSRAALDSRP